MDKLVEKIGNQQIVDMSEKHKDNEENRLNLIPFARELLEYAIPIISHVRDCEWMGRLIDAGIPIMDDPKDIPENLYTQAYLDNRLRVQAEEIRKELGKLILSDNMEAKSGVINYQDWDDYWRGEQSPSGVEE